MKKLIWFPSISLKLMNVRFCNVSQKIQIILISQHADVFQKHTTRIAFEYIYSANIFNTYVALCIVYCYDQYAIFRTIYNITKVVDMNTPVKESDNDLSVSGHIAFCEKNIYEVEKKNIYLPRQKNMANQSKKHQREVS